MNYKTIIYFILFATLQSCSLFESHPYDGHITGKTDINAQNINRIEKACEGKTTIRFIFMSDTQRWYNHTEDFVKAVNKRDDIDFVIHGGDISDFGLTKEFTWIRDIMEGLNVPYVALLGNHDCLANGMHIYNKIFGKENFSFLAGNTKFVCLNTNAIEFDYSRPIPDFSFIENECKDNRSEFQKTVVAMHVPPYSDDFNNNVARVFQYSLQQLNGLQFCLNGHHHRLTANDLFEDNIIYYGVSEIESHKYLLFTIKPNDEYDYEAVDF